MLKRTTIDVVTIGELDQLKSMIPTTKSNNRDPVIGEIFGHNRLRS